MRILMLSLIAMMLTVPAYAQEQSLPSDRDLPSVPSLEDQEAGAPTQPNVTIDAVEAAPGDETVISGPCADFAVKLYNCQKYSCSKQHSEKSGYTIKHAIMGLSPDGRLCRHIQTLPNGQVVDCKYTAPMRDLIVRMTAEGKTALSEGEQLLVSNVFRDQCEIKDATAL